MTVRDLISQLKDVDDDILDYEVWTTLKIQLNSDVVISARAKVLTIPENVDVENQRIYLRARE